MTILSLIRRFVTPFLVATMVAGFSAPAGVGHAAALPTPASAAPIPCRPAPGTTTIAQSASARIFSDDLNGNDYACLYSNGHAYYLSTAEHTEYRLVRFAGPYVAFVPVVEGYDGDIGVMDLRTGRRADFQGNSPVMQTGLHCAIGDLPPICYFSDLHVRSLVLTSDGAVAWLATGLTIEVRRHDRRGLRILDHGTGIVPTSLRLSGSVLHWTDAGKVRAAKLL